MQSRAFADLPGQSGELIAIHPQYGESVAPPVLAGPEDEIELALDFQGHKHVDPAEHGDEAYVLENDTYSSHTKFSMPGQATVNALREYLLKNLRAHQIVDGYGNVREMFEVPSGHLAVLQAKMWTKTSHGRSPRKATVSSPSRAQILMSDHVADISRLLEENHLFVLSETEHATCHYSNGLHETADHVCHSQMFRIEPLVHWGTVIPATASQFMASFRRNGGLMQTPAYKQLVRHSIDEKAPTYCFDCLEYLWSKRTEAQDIIRRFEGAVQRLSTYSSNSAYRLDNSEVPERSDPAIETKSLESFHSKSYQNKAVKTEMYDEVRMAPCQLDGTSEYFDVTESLALHATNKQKIDTVRELSDSEDVDEHCIRTRSSSRSNSFTHPLRTTPVKPKRSDEFIPPTGHQPSVQVRISTVPQVSNIAHGNSRTQTVYTTNKYGFRVKVPDSPLCAPKREFGRELDANCTIPFVQVRRSPRKPMDKAATHEGISVRPIKPFKPLKPLKPLKKAKNPTKETKKRKNAPNGLQTGKQKIARTAATEEPKPTESKPYIDSTAGLWFPPEPQPVVPPPSPPKLFVHFAKRPMGTTVPDGVSTLAYEAFQIDHPAPTSKICACNKVASYGLFRKSEFLQIAQCVNRDCRFGWYHYACLNQSEKGKARWGTLVCQHCRNEEEFADKDRKNGRGRAQHINFRTTWTKHDIEADMPGLGGHGPVVNPYGWGVEVDLGPAFRNVNQTKEVLGDLKSLGYAHSRPYMLVEAYSNPAAYAQLRVENETKEQWRYETHTTDGDCFDGEEMLDPETEEELLEYEEKIQWSGLVSSAHAVYVA